MGFFLKNILRRFIRIVILGLICELSLLSEIFGVFVFVFEKIDFIIKDGFRFEISAIIILVLIRIEERIFGIFRYYVEMMRMR